MSYYPGIRVEDLINKNYNNRILRCKKFDNLNLYNSDYDMGYENYNCLLKNNCEMGGKDKYMSNCDCGHWNYAKNSGNTEYKRYFYNSKYEVKTSEFHKKS